MDEIQESPTENGYGDVGCMNVLFYRKIHFVKKQFNLQICK